MRILHHGGRSNTTDEKRKNNNDNSNTMTSSNADGIDDDDDLALGERMYHEQQMMSRVNNNNNKTAVQVALPPSTDQTTSSHSLDFERVVNLYSIQATRDRLLSERRSGSNSIISSSSSTRRNKEKRWWRRRQPRQQNSNNDDPAEKSKKNANNEDNDREGLLFSINQNHIIPASGEDNGGYQTFGHQQRDHDEDEEDEDRTALLPPLPLPPPPPPPPPNSSSLSSSTKHRQQQQPPAPRKKQLSAQTGLIITRWVLTIMTGLFTGAIAIVITVSTEWMGHRRATLLNWVWQGNAVVDAVNGRDYEYTESLAMFFVVYSSINLVLALLSAMLTVYIAPEATGSGIPQVKAYLNGVRVRRFTNLRLVLVKIVGTILTVSSGLILGPEGPSVHIGAMMGASCTKLAGAVLHLIPQTWFCLTKNKCWTFVTMDLLPYFATDAERRDLISIGAAAGFASAFGAPIGGLLFSMEVTSSFFDQHMFLRTLAATAVATFIIATERGDLSNYSIISMGRLTTPDNNIFSNRIQELPLYVVVAVGGGVLGGLFCVVWKQLQLLRRRWYPKQERTRNYWKLVEVAVVSLLTSLVTYFVPLMEWTCRPYNGPVDPDLSGSPQYRLQYDCQSGEVNEIATIFFGSRVQAISKILSSPDHFQPKTLLVVGLMVYPLMTLALGVSVPSGIYLSTFLCGSAFGGWLGLLFHDMFDVPVQTFALIGAAALLASIQRSTVSTAVIVVEGTGQVKILLPTIITVVIARYIADCISKRDLYETAMDINQYPYLDHEEKTRYDIFQVREIMGSPPVVLSARERVDRVVALLRKTHFHGFPIVDRDDANRFIGGIVRRDQLVALIECGIFEESQDGDSGRGAPIQRDGTPNRGLGKSPVVNLDDRYDVLRDDELLEEDEFDENSWLLLVRERRHSLLKLLPDNDGEILVTVGDDSLPLINTKTAVSDCRKDATDESPPQEKIASVSLNKDGNVYVKWLNPHYRGKHLDLAAVMNRGTYCVTETCPVSKARYLFTALGLRHLVVLGGDGGGSVVGMVTRNDLLRKSIGSKTNTEID